MNTKRLLLASAMAWVLLWLPDSRSAAQTATDEKTTPPALEDSTLLVLRLDLTGIDVPAMTNWLQRIEPIKTEPESADKIATKIDRYLGAVRATGTDELFITMSTFDLMKATPVVKARTENPAALESLLSTLWNMGPPNRPSKMSQLGDYTVFGSERSVDRIVSTTNESAYRFHDFLQSSSLDHQLIVSLPAEAKADLVAMWPEEAPLASSIQFSPRQLAADLVAIKLSWSLPPKIDAAVELTAADADAAERVVAVVNQLLELIPADWESKPNVTVDGPVVVITGETETIARAATQAINQQFRLARELQTSNNLKQIGLAVHNYHSAYSKIPESIVDEDGKPLLSWRVTILPFLEQQAMFEAIDREQVWSAAENQLYGQTAILSFTSNESRIAETTIRIPTIEGSLWSDPEAPKVFRSIIDGLSNTIMVAVAPADQQVPWMKPEFWELDEEDLLGSFFGDRESALVLFFDGAVKKLMRDEMTEEKLRAMLTHANRDFL